MVVRGPGDKTLSLGGCVRVRVFNVCLGIRKDSRIGSINIYRLQSMELAVFPPWRLKCTFMDLKRNSKIRVWETAKSPI